MPRTVGIGHQNFEKLVTMDYFYIDKTMFIKEWWESGDEVTLITRPRRFGKTLNLSMVENFFSVEYTQQSFLASHPGRPDRPGSPKDPGSDAGRLSRIGVPVQSFRLSDALLWKKSHPPSG